MSIHLMKKRIIQITAQTQLEFIALVVEVMTLCLYQKYQQKERILMQVMLAADTFFVDR